MKKVLIILKKSPDQTFLTLVNQMKKEHEVNIYDLRKNKDYEYLVDDIFKHDNVISW